MPICPRCGLLVRGPRERCEKCGTLLPQATVRRQEDLEQALRQAEAEFAGPSPPPRRPSPARLALAALAGILVLWAGVFAWRVVDARNSIPYSPGTTWRFAVKGLEGTSLVVTLGEDTDLEGRSARLVRAEVEEGGERTLLGFGYLSRGLRGLDVIGVERAGAGAPDVGRARLLPFPYGPGSRWRSRLGGDWGQRVQFVLDFAAKEREAVTVPAGRYEALTVAFDLKPPIGPALLGGSFALARGVGPVRFRMDVPGGEFRGLRTVELELTEFSPGGEG